MEDTIYKLQKLLEEKGLPEFPSLLPHESRDLEIIEHLKVLCDHIICEVSKDNDVIALLSLVMSLPSETNLVEVEDALKGYKLIVGDFFEGESCLQEEQKKEVGKSFSFSVAGSGEKVKKKCTQRDRDEIDKECNVENYIIDRIKNEILEKIVDIDWNDIVGLENVKKSINEIVLWPMLRPDLFIGLRGPPRGLLLFGPPGTGKTMIGKCIASRCRATFFSISASSLASKWVGEGEKMVRALFHLSRSMQPSVIFIDEIDSLLSQRSENENEGSRRIKTEFLVQFDGAATSNDDRILIIGATNRPHEIDEAARRRLVKRIYVPLPDGGGRKKMVENLIEKYKNTLESAELDSVVEMTEGYSGSDIFNLCREASLEPLREMDNIENFKHEDIRPISLLDFQKAITQIRKSVSEKDLGIYSEWNTKFGST